MARPQLQFEGFTSSYAECRRVVCGYLLFGKFNKDSAHNLGGGGGIRENVAGEVG